MNIQSYHQKVLDIYLKHREENPDFTFASRVRQSDPRLAIGYWFQGNDNYLFSSPFNAGDSDNKTKTIGFVLNFSDGKISKQYIAVVFGDPKNKEMIDFYKPVLEICDIEFEEDKYKYKKQLKGNWESNLRQFLNGPVKKINQLIKEQDLEDKLCISDSTFQKTYSNIVNVKNNPSLFESHDDDEGSKISMKMLSPKNTILYGPPGTGKTYNSKQLAVEFVTEASLADATREEINDLYDDYVNSGQIVFTTFHQSMGYEDFIEGIKPVVDDDSGDLSYSVENGIFKELSLRAKDNLRKSKLDDTATEQDQYLENLMQEFKSSIEEQVVDSPLRLTKSTKIVDVEEDCLRYRRDSLSENAKGAKITFADLKHMHINSVLSRPDVTKLQGLKGRTTYLFKAYELLKEFEENTFTTMGVQDASTAENLNHYVIIIDEINRGNISSIFGELITLIEKDKRIGMPEALELVLPYSKEKFGVPANLHIIGTMNTADRSIEALDTALRRRFTFEEMMPDSSLVKNNPYLQLAKFWVDQNENGLSEEVYRAKELELLKWLNINDEEDYHENKAKILRKFGKDEDLLSYSDSPQYIEQVTKFYSSKGWQFNPIRLDKVLERINVRLVYLLDRDHTIGHSFFMEVNSLSDLRKVFTNQIIPQLKEYFYGDWNKIGMVLGSAFISKDKNQVKWPKGFTADEDYDEYENINISKLWNTAHFQSIYDDEALAKVIRKESVN